MLIVGRSPVAGSRYGNCGPLSTQFAGLSIADRLLSNGDNVHYTLEATEVLGIARVQRQAGRGSGGRDQEIDGSFATGLSSSGHDGGKDSSVGASCISVKRDGFQSCFNPLKSVLANGALVRITRRVDASGQLSQANCGDAGFLRHCTYGGRVD